MVLTGAPPALAQAIGLWSLDESPRWLASNGQREEARRALSRMYPSAVEDQIEQHMDAFERSTATQDEGVVEGEGIAALVGGRRGAKQAIGIKDIFGDPSARSALLLACGLQASQQLVGANSM